MSKKFIVTVMLGMNRSRGKDADHPFDMSVLDGINTIWLPQISDIEKTNSTAVYEMGKTISTFIMEFNSECASIDEVTKDDFIFIVGRGTIGSGSEDCLAEALLEARRVYGRNAYHLMYGMSYGVVDTLKTLSNLKDDGTTMNVDIMICIDGYAAMPSRLSVSDMYNNEQGKRERMFVIPKNVKKCFAIVQRREGYKGLRVARLNAPNRWNFIMSQKQIDSNSSYYSEYCDGYERRLELKHSNMEEIASVVPCWRYGGRMYTVNDLIKFFFRKYKDGKG